MAGLDPAIQRPRQVNKDWMAASRAAMTNWIKLSGSDAAILTL
jgi:hypothetical protein